MAAIGRDEDSARHNPVVNDAAPCYRSSLDRIATITTDAGTDAMQTDPTDLLDGLFTQTQRLLSEMARTEDLEQRRLQSETVRNLCGSIGIFFDAMSEAMSLDNMLDFDDDDEDDED